MKPFAFIFGIIFFICAYLQFNDPDPAIWILIYGMAGLACFMAYYGYWPAWVYGAMALVYIGGAIYQWPPEFEGIFFDEIGKMRSINVELARESLGLALSAVVLAVLGLLVRRG